MEVEKKNQVSARLGTVIIIVVLLIITLAIAIVILNKKTNDDNAILGNNLVQKANNSDLIMNFLKLENGKKNMIYSPLSIKYALSILNEGADGKTKEQIEKVLGNANLVRYENQDKVLSLANSIYIRDNYKQNIKEEYKNTLVQKYQAEIQYDSFKNAKNVNRWIEQKTLGIIKNIIADEIVQNPYTKVLLINALAIDMEWKSQFILADLS
ncbi:MAG: serpin family protein [Clostridia bacterium]|nr:serpin family protein [Clostridia bacterium]